MAKTKNFGVLLLVAMLGGFFGVSIDKWLEPHQPLMAQSSAHIKRAAYDFNPVTIPTFNFADVSEVVTPTVVHITTVSTPKATSDKSQDFDPFDLFGGGFGFQMPKAGPQMASGSGVIISADGYIVTNNHVVGNADEITVVLSDKRSYKADVIGKDPNTDIALLKIKASDLTPIQIGNSNDVRVGDWVLAVGNPFNLTSTVTAGIISAKGRNINLLGGNTAIESFIQTDAAVNPGNSGGALVDAKGTLVGINTAIASQTGQYEGYSFAVPVNIVKKVVNDLMQYGEVQRGFLGLQIEDVNAKIAEDKGLDKPFGVYVKDVTDNSAAGDAGIKTGDIISKVDDRSINSVPELLEVVGQHRPGDVINVKVVRSGKEKDFAVTLRNRDGKTGPVASGTKSIRKTLGATFESTTDNERNKLKIGNGVKVATLDKGLLKDAGIPQGFIIVQIDKTNVYTTNDVYRLLDGKKGGILIEGYLPSGEKKYYVLEVDNG